MRTRDLTAEMWTAHSALNAADRRELEQHGVSTSAIDRFKLVDIARVNRIPDTVCAEDDAHVGQLGRILSRALANATHLRDRAHTGWPTVWRL